MELFADLRDAGYFNGSHEHQCLLRYCLVMSFRTWMSVLDCGTVTGSGPPKQHHVQEECPMSSTTYHTGLTPETVDFKLNRLNWMLFLRLP
ncbi:hypothetical protein D4764_0229390 [Takifugu flavidus]|uniref:Uncharacterized protein n=1 Tax=Takifugu flavidus TaxID=433684 RepID=A0A5C6MNF3_9TELE|nr:hypothetical protein D4764_0229390 [Takifugu flavidus]